MKKDKINLLLKAGNVKMEAIAEKLKVHPILVKLLKEDLQKKRKK